VVLAVTSARSALGRYLTGLTRAADRQERPGSGLAPEAGLGQPSPVAHTVPIRSGSLARPSDPASPGSLPRKIHYLSDHSYQSLLSWRNLLSAANVADGARDHSVIAT
jgi:hypothetical protein